MSAKMLLTVLILAALTSGCSMAKIEATDVALEQARAESRAACVRARADADQARMAAIGAMEPGAQGYALMADAMARQAEALAGKDPCASGIGAYEARVAEVQSRNKVVEGLGGKALTSSVLGLGLYTFGDVAKHGIDKAGDKTSIQGDNNAYTQERVQNTSETSTRALGDGAQANSAAPVVSGPDKSSHTNIEAPEPVAEEPEIDEPEVEAPEVEEPAAEVAGE